jgi:glycosyltransferase involved in cell wall biosynthesis
MQELTIIIKTFNRKRSLWKLLSSIEKYFPKLNILIVDDSLIKYKKPTLNKFHNLNIKYITKNFDIGLSQGRNILLENVQTDLFLLCDDDFEFDERTNLIDAVNILRTEKADIVGGSIFDIYRINSIYSILWALSKPLRIVSVIKKMEILSIYNGIFEIINNDVTLKINRYFENYNKENRYETDIVSNFFIADTKKIVDMKGWQPEGIKVGEHQAFFYRAKINKLKVLYSPIFGAKHYPKKGLFYIGYRMRAVHMFKKSFEMLGLNSYKTIDENGKILYSYRRKSKRLEGRNTADLHVDE